jgi:hypothetical protein
MVMTLARSAPGKWTIAASSSGPVSPPTQGCPKGETFFRT